MQRFEYASPTSVDEAVHLLAEKGRQAAVLAGGTDLLSLMKDGAVSPQRLVNIKAIEALHGIRLEPEPDHSGMVLNIGCLTSLETLRTSRTVASRFPALAQAAAGLAAPQIRNMGTVGGDLCQRPRCWYFRHGHGLLAQRDGRSLVVDGDNRYHAILGNRGPAFFVNPSSLAPALIAHGARVQLAGPKGERTMDLDQLYLAPTAAGQSELRLMEGEILTRIEVPATFPSPGENRRPGRPTGSATYEVRQRQVMDRALASAAAVIEMDGDVIRSARVVLGQVAPTPWHVPEADALLLGRPAVPRVAEVAGEAAVKGARSLSRNDYKIRLARVAYRRAVLLAAGEEIGV